jgi:hypothetical protein
MVGNPGLMHSEAEVRPDRTVLAYLRHAPISPSPPLDRQAKRLRAPHTPLGLTSVKNHGDSRIGLEALAQMPPEFSSLTPDHDEPSTQPPLACRSSMMALDPAGSGPRLGTCVTLMDPASVAFLAIMVMVHWTRRARSPPGRGFREPLPEHIPVPGYAA